MLVVVIVAVLVAQGQQNKQLDETFVRIARHHDGNCITGGIFGRPAVRFVHRGVRVLLDVYSTGGKAPTLYTQLHLSWPNLQLRLEVFPENLFGMLGKYLGTQDIVIGSPAFDRDYIIRGNDEQEIKEVLTPRVQAKINALREFLGNRDIFISTKAGTLLIKKRELIKEFGLLERFITMGLELYDELVKGTEQGIDFVGQQESAFSLDVSNAVCQICGESIGSDAVFCRSCKTPHHRDCWVYYGKCSTYGCGESRYNTTRR